RCRVRRFRAGLPPTCYHDGTSPRGRVPGRTSVFRLPGTARGGRSVRGLGKGESAGAVVDAVGRIRGRRVGRESLELAVREKRASGGVIPLLAGSGAATPRLGPRFLRKEQCPMLRSSWTAAGRRAFTLIELLVVIAII